MKGEPCLQGDEVTRTFGRGDTLAVALREVSLRLCPGQFSLVMGPSGCGKSTLLAALSGLLRPNSGQVRALGQDLYRLSDKQRREFRRRHFGFIFQGFNLFATLTVREQIEMILRWGEGMPHREARKRTQEMLAQMDMGRKETLLPAQLSGGEKQRVAIARALIKDPEFCFADEPTSALDWGHGKDIIRLLRSASQERDATVLVVAHDPRIIPFADRLFEMNDGRVEEREITQELVKQYSF